MEEEEVGTSWLKMRLERGRGEHTEAFVKRINHFAHYHAKALAHVHQTHGYRQPVCKGEHTLSNQGIANWGVWKGCL